MWIPHCNPLGELVVHSELFRGVALRSEDSAISSVTNKSFRIPVAHPILSLRSFSRISGGGLIEEDEWRRYGLSPAALVVWVAQLLKRASLRAIKFWRQLGTLSHWPFWRNDMEIRSSFLQWM